jgi:hypothetical protein
VEVRLGGRDRHCRKLSGGMRAAPGNDSVKAADDLRARPDPARAGPQAHNSGLGAVRSTWRATDVAPAERHTVWRWARGSQCSRTRGSSTA